MCFLLKFFMRGDKLFQAKFMKGGGDDGEGGMRGESEGVVL